MNELSFYLIPIFGAIIGCSSVVVCSWQLRMQLKSIGDISDEDTFIERKVEQLISERLDAVVTAFKSQIPMASTFLSQAREDKLKNQAREELLKIVPDVLMAIPGNLPIERVTDRLWRSMLTSLLLFAAIVGAILGFVEVGILSLF